MRIKQLGLCRGSGKIFIEYSVDIAKDATLELTNTTEDGKQIPSKLFPTDSDYVVVIPNLPITQILSFTELSPDGSPIGDQVKKKITFEGSKWESRLNYRIHKDRTQSIRNYDDYHHDDIIQIHLWEAIADDDRAKVRIALIVPFSKIEDLDIQFFKDGMNDVSLPLISMGIEKHPGESQEDVPFTLYRFTLILPDISSYYLISVHDRNHPEYDNFAVIDPIYLRNELAIWNSHRTNASGDDRYTAWFSNKKATKAKLKRQSQAQFEIQPEFSIITPLYKTAVNWFKAMAESVIAQSYANWELVLINASPKDKKLRHVIEEYSRNDPRIKVITLDENLGISRNTQAGIDSSTGDYLCFLDHDDLLEPDALFEYAKAINADPSIDLIYCDEDKLLPNGKLFCPYFKPDYSIDLLRSNNYICHFLCIRKSVYDQLEPSGSDVDGAQDHDLILKTTEKTSNIHHIPRVLYHWRIHESSTSGGVDAKPEAVQAGIRAVQNHLNRLNLDATVTENEISFTYDVNYAVQGQPLVSIIIPNKDESKVLKTCIDSIIDKSTYTNYEIVIIENNSTEDETFLYYGNLESSFGSEKLRIEYWKDSFNFSKLINFGVEKSKGEYLIFLNNDTEVITSDWIERMLGICQRNDVGVVGAKLWYPDDTLQHAGVVLLKYGPDHKNKGINKTDVGYFGLPCKMQNVSAVTAACMMTKRSIFEEVNGMDENLVVAYNDVDYCLKVLELGYLIVYTPSVNLYHYESLSRGSDETPSRIAKFLGEKAFFANKWDKYYGKPDKYFNKNLSQNSPHYELADLL